MLTHKVTDGCQLPVLLHAHIAPIAGFECHPPATPLHLEHGIGRTEGNRARSPQQQEMGAWGLASPSSSGSRALHRQHHSELPHPEGLLP